MCLHHIINSILPLLNTHLTLYEDILLYSRHLPCKNLTTFGKAMPEKHPRTASSLLSPVELIWSIKSNTTLFIYWQLGKTTYRFNSIQPCWFSSWYNQMEIYSFADWEHTLAKYWILLEKLAACGLERHTLYLVKNTCLNHWQKKKRWSMELHPAGRQSQVVFLRAHS